MASTEQQDEEFNFYLKFAKPLVLTLADTNDRIKAASWIRKLRFDKSDPVLRGDYLKLLLFVLQRRKLIGPFATIPDDSPLEPFPDEINLQDVAKNFMEIDKRVLKETLEKGGFGEWPPYTVACSADLTEYAATQEIPNFGTQVYFAISKEPLQAWDHCEKALFPIGENVDLTKPDSTLASIPSPNISSFVSAEQAAQATSPKRGATDGYGDGMGASPDSQKKSPGADRFGVDAQISPTWGSNLVKVNEAPSPPAVGEDEDMDLDFDVSDRDLLDFDESMSLIGDSDLDESFYLQGDALLSPDRPVSPAPSLPYMTPKVPTVSLPSPAPSLPYATPKLPGPQLPSPAPSLPYKTPPPKSPAFFPQGVDDQDMLDFEASLDLTEDVEFFDAVSYLQDDVFSSPPRAPQSPAPSLPYSTPRLPGPQLPSPAPSLPYATPRVPGPQLPSPAPSLPYATPRLPGPQLPSPAPSLPYRTPRLPGPQLPSPAPSLPYRTPRLPGPQLPSPAPSLPYKTPPTFQGQTLQGGERIQAPICPCVSASRETSPAAGGIKKPSPKQTPEYLRLLRDLECLLDEATPPAVAGPSSTTQKIAKTIKGVIRDVSKHKPSVGILKEATMELDTSGEGLGGESFIAEEKKGFGWLDDIKPGPGLPEDEEQDPALWESFGWWTDDPDEIFMDLTPTPERRMPSISTDPYEAERKRWEDVPPTPPLFSKDRNIREGPGGQRIYGIEEFGMESWEEPAWEPAEQFFKYRTEMSPYAEYRDVDRQAMRPSQYPVPPAAVSPLSKRLEDVVPSEEDLDFGDEEPPNIADISFTEKDFVPMTRAEANVEAFYHGAMPPIDIEHEIDYDAAMHDVGFLASTPEKHIMQQASVFTPPSYQPPDVNAKDLDESIAKYIDDEMQIITSEIPVTTPAMSASPKRQQKLLLDDTPPTAIDDELNQNICMPCSPELKTPTKHKQVTHKIDWETNIGEVKSVSPLRKPGYTAQDDDERIKANAKRTAEIAAAHERQFYELPFETSSPERPPHPFDERIPDHLPGAISPEVLPPANWAWKSPPKIVAKPQSTPIRKQPTGISPVQQLNEGMFIESPPDALYSPPSPSAAVAALQGSPSRLKSPSPIRSPGGRPCWDKAKEPDEIEREELFPTDYVDLDEEDADLYHSPENLQAIQNLDERIAALEKSLFSDSPSKKPPAPKNQQAIQSLNDRIKALEESLLSDLPRKKPPPQTDDESIFQRQLWRDSISIHKKTAFPDKKFIIRPKPGKSYAVTRSRKPGLPTIEASPPSPPRIPTPLSKDEAVREGQRQLLDILFPEEAFQEAQKRYKDLMLPEKLKIPAKTPISRTTTRIEFEKDEPIPQISPVRQPQLEPFDIEAAMQKYQTAEPPPDWSWRTPPKLHAEKRSPTRVKTPTGISPPTNVPEDITMFYESPPIDVCSPVCSPSKAVASIRHTPPVGFGEELQRSPIKSPGGRAMEEYDSAQDEIDMAHQFPDDYDFDALDEEDAPEPYQSPPPPETPENIRQHRQKGYELSPPTPEDQREAWKQCVCNFEPYSLSKNYFPVKPKPGKTYRISRTSRGPNLPSVAERPPSQLSGIPSKGPTTAKQSKLRAVCPGAPKKDQISGLVKPSKISKLPWQKSARGKPVESASSSVSSIASCPGVAKKTASGQSSQSSIASCPGVAKGKSTDSATSSQSSIRPGAKKKPPKLAVRETKASQARAAKLGKTSQPPVVAGAKKKPVSAQSSKSSIASGPGGAKRKPVSAKSSKSSIASSAKSSQSSDVEGKSIESATSSQSAICPGAKKKPSKLVVRGTKASQARAAKSEEIKKVELARAAKASRKPGAKSKIKSALPAPAPAPAVRPCSPKLVQQPTAAEPQRICSPCPAAKSPPKLTAEEEERIARRGRGLRRIREQFAGPPRPPSPPEGGYHPFDEPVPQQELPRALLPPSGWGWKTPPKLQIQIRSPRVIRRPTGLSPPKEFDDVSLYYESPPQSPTAAVTGIQHTPSPGFGRPPSPIRSPSGRPAYPDWQNAYLGVDLDSAKLYDTFDEIDAEDEPYLPVIDMQQPTPPRISPKNLDWQIPSPTAVSNAYTTLVNQGRNRYPNRPGTTSPEQKQMSVQMDLKISQSYVDNRISELEDELFSRPSSTFASQIPARTNVSPTRRRPRLDQSPPGLAEQMLRHNIDQHNLVPYKDKNFVVHPKSGKAYIISKGRKPPLDTLQEVRTPPTSSLKSRTPSPRTPSPCGPPHLLDDAIPEDLPRALLPPSGWDWKTPPGVKYQQYVNRVYKSPTAVSPPRQYSPGSIFVESPPDEYLPETEDFLEPSPPRSPPRFPARISPTRLPERSPTPICEAVCSLPSPIKSPGGRPIVPTFHNIEDDIDLADAFPTDYEDVGEEQIPQYESPPKTPPHLRERQKRMKNLGLLPTSPRAIARQELLDLEREVFTGPPQAPPPQSYQPGSSGTPPTPEYQRKIWQQELMLKDKLKLKNKTWIVKPKPGKAYRVTKAKAPKLSPIKEKFFEYSPPVRSPVDMQQLRTPPSVPPENWAWKTPSPQSISNAYTELVNQGQIPFASQPAATRTSPGVLTESPPFEICSPESPCPSTCSEGDFNSPIEDFDYDFYVPEISPPMLSPPVRQSPLRSPGGRPIIPDWVSAPADDIDIAQFASNQYDDMFNDQMLPEEFAMQLPPTPPPLPAPPQPYYHKIYLDERNRPKPDRQMFSSPSYQPCSSTPKRKRTPISQRLVHRTPPSAGLPYEPVIEARRYEQHIARPEPARTSPLYETPGRSRRQGRRIRRDRDRPRRRLDYDEDAYEEERFQEAVATCPATSQDIVVISPPQDLEMIQDIPDYEPQQFNLYEPEQDYDVRLPFEGQPNIFDNAFMQEYDEIPEDERDFRWMDCDTICSGNRSK